MESKLTPLKEFFQTETGDVTAQMLVDMLRDVHNSQREVVDMLAKHSIDFKEHVTQDAAQFQQFMSAFPGGDIGGHQRYHQAIIDWLELRNRTIKGALTKASEVGFIAALGWIVYALWVAFLKGPGG